MYHNNDIVRFISLLVWKSKRLHWLFLVCVWFSFQKVFPAIAPDSAYYSIGHISFDRKNIFDVTNPDDQFFFSSFINGIHIVTKENVIRRELLFFSDQSYDKKLVEESERHLRETGILGDARIHPDTLGSIINLNVQTQDKFTLGVNTSYKQEGGIRSFFISLKDDNFLGNAQKVSINCNYSSDRKDPYGLEAIASEPRLFGSWWKLKAQYKNSEELKISTLQLDHPFYAENALWAGGIYVETGNDLLKLYENGDLKKGYRLTSNKQHAYYTYSVADQKKLQTGIAYKRIRTSSVDSISAVEDNLDLLYATVGTLQNEFHKKTFLNNFGRTEDVPTGISANLSVGKGFDFTPEKHPDYWFYFSNRYAVFPFENVYAALTYSFSTFVSENELHSSIWDIGLIQYFKFFERQTTVIKFSRSGGKFIPVEKQNTLGSPTGLRGYNAHEFNGTQKALINFEHRFFPNLSLWFFNIGGVVFCDTGTIWKEGRSIYDQQFHSGIGIGLRIENSKQQGSGILRIDVAFNSDQRKFTEIIISSDQLINAFTTLNANF